MSGSCELTLGLVASISGSECWPGMLTVAFRTVRRAHDLDSAQPATDVHVAEGSWCR